MPGLFTGIFLSMLYHPIGTVRFLPFRHGADGELKNVKVWYCPDGLWRDQLGGIYAFAEQGASVGHLNDPRCGIAPLELPEGHPLNDACKPHDFETSSPGWQTFHTRSESTQNLERRLYIVAGNNKLYRALVQPMVHIADFWTRIKFWENPATNI